MKILLVADDPWVTNDVAAAQSDETTQLETTTDSRHVDEIVAAGRPDVVIVDMQVKAMGGVAVTRLLEGAMATGRVPKIPVILLLDRQADVFIARRSGASAHLVKPFTAQELRETIGRLVPAASV